MSRDLLPPPSPPTSDHSRRATHSANGVSVEDDESNQNSPNRHAHRRQLPVFFVSSHYESWLKAKQQDRGKNRRHTDCRHLVFFVVVQRPRYRSCRFWHIFMWDRVPRPSAGHFHSYFCDLFFYHSPFTCCPTLIRTCPCGSHKFGPSHRGHTRNTSTHDLLRSLPLFRCAYDGGGLDPSCASFRHPILPDLRFGVELVCREPHILCLSCTEGNLETTEHP